MNGPGYNRNRVRHSGPAVQLRPAQLINVTRSNEDAILTFDVPLIITDGVRTPQMRAAGTQHRFPLYVENRFFRSYRIYEIVGLVGNRQRIAVTFNAGLAGLAWRLVVEPGFIYTFQGGHYAPASGVFSS